MLARFLHFISFRSNGSKVAYDKQIVYLEDEGMNYTIIGIDISKKSLDVYSLNSRNYHVFTNNEEGIKALLEYYHDSSPKKAIVESTGPYQRLLHRELEKAGWIVSVVNPYKARCFAKSAGFLAKTDKVDSRMLALYGEKLLPEPTLYPSSFQVELESLVHYRATLVEELKRQRNQLEDKPAALLVASMIDTTIQRLKENIRQLDRQIEKTIKSNEASQTRQELLKTVPGIGLQTIAALQCYLPELGTLNRKQIASLGGVAPFLCDSGQFRGRAMIKGGRAKVCKALYMPILTCINFNPPMKAFYRRLRDRGKPAKVALTACMRKLLTTLNTMVKTKTAWRFGT